MASIRIERWKQVYSSDPANKYVVPPEHHPYAWLIPRWWYKGSRTIYETCVKIQGSTYQMYVDGFTPAMVFECEVSDDFKLTFTEARDIRRVVVTTAYAELIDPDGEYLDIAHTLTDSWVVRHNSLPAPIVDVPPVWTTDPTYMSGDSSTDNPTVVIGGPLSARSGEFDGGMPSPTGEPLKFRARWQVRDTADALSNGPWVNVGESEVTLINSLSPDTWWPTDYKDIRFMNQIRDFDPDGNTRTSNRFTGWKTINNALAVQTEATIDPSNVNEPGNTLLGTTATFVDGIEPITYQYRWQAGVDLLKVETKDGGTFNTPWTEATNGGPTTVGYVVGDIQNYVRLQSQATDATGKVVDSFSATATITLPPPPDPDPAP